MLEKETLRQTDLVQALGEETGLPPSVVEAVCLANLRVFAQLIERQENFNSPRLVLKCGTVAARAASEGRPDRAEQKYAQMLVRPGTPQQEEIPLEPADS